MQDNEETTEAEQGEDLGSKLKAAREARNLSIDAIAAELRIGPHLLSALEEGRFEALDAPVFARGYLKQYGARLGLNVAELVEQYNRAASQQTVEIAPSATIRLRDERQITFWIITVIVLLAIAGALGAWWWLGQESIGDLFSTSTEEPIAAVAEVEPEPVAPPAAEFVPGAVEVAEVAEVADASEVQAAEVPVADALAEPADAAPAGTVAATAVLEIRFLADSWTEISNDSGERLLYKLGSAGTVENVPADRPLSLFFGNAAGIELSFNGEPVEIPAAARRDELAQFSLDLRGR